MLCRAPVTLYVEFMGSTPCHRIPVLLTGTNSVFNRRFKTSFRLNFDYYSVEEILKVVLYRLFNTHAT